jgi:hypothetical protein
MNRQNIATFARDSLMEISLPIMGGERIDADLACLAERMGLLLRGGPSLAKQASFHQDPAGQDSTVFTTGRLSISTGPRDT